MSWLARSQLLIALLAAGDVAAEDLAGDEAGRVVLAGVDPQAGAQAGERGLQLRVGARQGAVWAIKELTFVLIRLMNYILGTIC